MKKIYYKPLFNLLYCPLLSLGTRDATNFGPVCLQPPAMTGDSPQSEDCLSLDIYTPVNPNKIDASKSANRKAVMVWIHGGAFSMGSSSQYDGKYLYARVVLHIFLQL